MTTATLNLKYLHAAAQAVSTDETRYYLNGVCVEIERDTVTYVATDGHILFCYRDPDSGPHDLLGTYIIPTATIKLAKLDAKTKRAPAVLLKQLDGRKMELATFGAGFVFEAIDGTFPDWRRVIPAEAEPAGPPKEREMQHYNPALVSRLWKAGALIDHDKPTLIPNGGGPAYMVYSDPNAFGVLMPLRPNVPIAKTMRPAWIAPVSQLAEAAD